MISPYEASIFATKTAIVLLFVAGLYRLIGKRYVAQWNLYDLVAVVAMSNAVQNAMTEGRGQLAIGIVSSFTLLGIGWILSRVFVRAPRLQKAVIGTPTLLIYDGHLMKDRIRREQVSPAELRAALHQHGLSRVDQVGMAVLELDGSISVVPIGRGCKFDTDLI